MRTGVYNMRQRYRVNRYSNSPTAEDVIKNVTKGTKVVLELT